MQLVVLDPGHGGEEVQGRSTPTGVVGLSGVREKDVTLRLAQGLRDELAKRSVRALLTREGDENLSLAARTFVSRAEDAAAFVSLHADARALGDTGPRAWVHPRANAASRRLAEAVSAVQAGELAVLEPRQHAQACAACLIEAGNLRDPADEARLASAEGLGALAAQLADAIAGALQPANGAPQPASGAVAVRSVEERFDVWHEVPLVHQTSGMSCWAAAAAMLVGWRDCIDLEADDVARGSGRWEEFRDGLQPESVQALADAFGLQVEPPRRYTPRTLAALLEQNGPLWVGEASPGLHVVVITGAAGDGSPEGTRVRIADPWPVGRGERYSISFAELQQNLEAAAGISGVPAQILHTGGRGSSRRVVRQRHETMAWFGPQLSLEDAWH